MRVRRLVLNDYRSYEHLDVSFDSDNIFITGDNGTGKTNIIESIYYMTLGRSFRKADDIDLIRKGATQASIYLEYHSDSDDRDHTVSCIISEKAKAFAFDDEKIKSIYKIFGKLITVYYEPSFVFLFRSDPETRRKLLDETLSQISPEYLYALANYKKLLKNRNAAMQDPVHYDQDIVDHYRDQMINMSYRIIKNRNDLIRIASKRAQKYYSALFGDNEKKLEFCYRTNCPLDEDEESFVRNSKQAFESSKTLENIRHTTAIGPHRDDFQALLNGNEVAEYGSQGENRLASLSLKLAILDILSQKKGDKPILLLDDITSDLDDKRCENLLKIIQAEHQQIFITGTKVRGRFSDFTVMRTSEDNNLVKEVTENE